MDRWILDPGSNVHVCNSINTGWQQTRESQNDDYVLAGSSSVPVAAWGKVTLTVNTPQGPQKVLITNVALVPGFVTNLLSLSRCSNKGIHFDSGEDCLYSKAKGSMKR